MEIEITTDGRTVWVNNEFGLLGRFGVFGIDVHQPIEQQQSGECLHCTHERTTAQDWLVFVEKMREHHGVNVGAGYVPTRFYKVETQGRIEAPVSFESVSR